MVQGRNRQTKMIWQRIAHNLREIATEIVAVAGLRYPGFVYGGPLRKGEVPVFCLHTVEEQHFESQLLYLKHNGYTTLSTDEFYAVITRRRPAPERCVLLTFDDGWRSVWTTALPLLRRYGMRATLFVIPRRTPSTALLRPNLEDIWNGKVTRETFALSIQDTPDLMTWQEIAAAHESGVLDIQSHSLTHGLVYTRPEIVDFIHPELLEKLHPNEIPLLRNGAGDYWTDKPLSGTPLYRSAPGLAVRTRYLESCQVRKTCVDYVAANGGEVFFRKPVWRAQLSRIEASARALAQDAGYETRQERTAAVNRELTESKREIEQHLPGHRVRHFCLPWGYALSEVVDFLRKAGYLTNFWLDAPGCWSRCMRIGGDPLRIPRLGENWIRLLPGSQRDSLAFLLLAKLRRRFTQGSSYLTHH